MSAPKRIQRKRTKGWRMPEGAVYVGRPTKWGNPFVVKQGARFAGMPGVWFVLDENDVDYWPDDDTKQSAIERAVRLFAWALMEGLLPAITAGDVLRELEGRDLACWCPLDQPCHADALLELANPTTSGDPA